MKGVILSREPRARIVDVCHDLPPQDVRAGAFALMQAAPYFPAGTLFVCVVDPGVGSGRAILWASDGRCSFLAPDNGLLSWTALRRPLREVRRLTNRSLRLPSAGATFHGRDVFAPAAAALAGGLSPAALGPRARSWRRIPLPRARGGGGEVLALDRFGNAVTSIPAERARAGTRFAAAGLEFPLSSCYAAVPAGRPLAVAGSAGFIELALREGDLAGSRGVRVGDKVHVC